MKILKIIILRSYFNDCTLGRVLTNTPFKCFSLELPWKGNASKVSCIPEGIYDAYIRYSPNQKREVITLKDVPERTWINIEVGNYTNDILGCVVVGRGVHDINHDTVPDVTSSGETLDELLQIAKQYDKIEVQIRTASIIGAGVYI